MKLTKREKVAFMLYQAGFKPCSEFTVVFGTKAKSDILECWHVDAMHEGRQVEVYSAYTMTELCRRGLKVVPNRPETCLYGEFVAEPKDVTPAK